MADNTTADPATKQPATKEDVQARFDSSPFISFLGIEVLSLDADKEEIVVRMPMRPELERRKGTGQYNGGAIAALIDIAGDFALFPRVGSGVPTINYRNDYLRPAVDTALTATARVRRFGRTVSVVDVDVADDKGRTVAIGRGTYSSTAG